MKNFFIALMSFLGVAFVLAIIILFNLKGLVSNYLHIRGFAVVSIVIVSLFVVTLLIYATINSSKDDPFALGLPDGSVRALVAVLVLVFFILISVAIYFTHRNDSVGSDIVKTLSTLLIAVSAFYFGSKATEQGFNAGASKAGEAVDKATAATATATAAAVMAVAKSTGTGDDTNADATGQTANPLNEEAAVETNINRKSQDTE